MLVFSDVISDDRMLSDSFPIREVDDVVYEVDCRLIQPRRGADIDIGAGPPAEEAQEELGDGGTNIIDVIDAFQLQSIIFDKESYIAHLKGYLRAIERYLQETDPSRVQEFEKNVNGYVKKILGNFNNYEFYTGGSMNTDGMVALLNYREDGVTPFFTFWKNGLRAVH